MADAFTGEDVPDQTGRTFLVTGANTGIGFEAAKVLAHRGARVLFGCRSEHKARAAMAEVAAGLRRADLDFVALDQSELASVEAAADRVNTEERLDVLINNAGIMMPPRTITVDGFESQLGVNHLATFALTSHLLPKLGEQEGSRVVVTSSLAHRGAPLFFGDIDGSRRYRARDRYGQSKLANLLFMYELQRRLETSGSPTISVGCHPGIADTDLARDLNMLKLVMPLMRPFLNSAAEGAWPTLMAATAPDVAGGRYYGPSKRGESAGPATQVESSARSKSTELADRLWELSIEMTGVDPGI